jgi:hypothetical protein
MADGRLLFPQLETFGRRHQLQGRAAMRISVSAWATSDADIERSLDAILQAHSDA